MDVSTILSIIWYVLMIAGWFCYSRATKNTTQEKKKHWHLSAIFLFGASIVVSVVDMFV